MAVVGEMSLSGGAVVAGSVIILLALTVLMVVLLPLCLWRQWSQRCKERAASVRSNDSTQGDH